MYSRKVVLCAIAWIQVLSILACRDVSTSTSTSKNTPSSTAWLEQVERGIKIPGNAVKMSPESDAHPPLLASEDFESPVPVPGEVNTAGAEDSPYILPDGNTLYFFFTPDVAVPVEKQILDGVTGIYASQKVAGEWSKPERILLQDSGKLAMDGCEFILGEIMWFCTVREGYTSIHWFTAVLKNSSWQNWQIADFNPDFKVGELHFTNDGTQLYFHSDRPSGKGQLDIWVSKKSDGIWQEPVNVVAVNTGDSEGWPALNPAGDELWFTRNYGIWRSRSVNGAWQTPELIVSPLAGEPTIDRAGNLYFTHHFYIDDQMIEADIYVAYKR